MRHLLGELGLDPTWIQALQHSWSSFNRYYQSGKCLSEPAAARRGLPQGCPLSPALSLLLMAPLLRWLEARGIISISFADDLSMMGSLAQIREARSCRCEPTSRDLACG